MKLPPHGKLIDNSRDTIFLWAGEHHRVNQSVRTFGKNSIAFYAPNNPEKYIWPVHGRDVAVIHFFEPSNFWIKQIIVALYQHHAARIAELSWPHCGAWWNPHYDIYTQFFKGIDQQITINHYEGR